MEAASGVLTAVLVRCPVLYQALTSPPLDFRPALAGVVAAIPALSGLAIICLLLWWKTE